MKRNWIRELFADSFWGCIGVWCLLSLANYAVWCIIHDVGKMIFNLVCSWIWA